MAYGCGLGLIGFEPEDGVSGVVGMGEVGVVGTGGRVLECESVGGEMARVVMMVIVVNKIIQGRESREVKGNDQIADRCRFKKDLGRY